MNDRIREQRLSQFASFYVKRLQVQANLAPQRLADFRVSVDGRYQCPKCWIYDGIPVSLEQIASPTPGHGTFECERCGRFELGETIPDKPP